MTKAEQIAEAEAVCFTDPWSLNSVRSLAETGIMLTVEENDRLAGYVLGAVNADEAELYRIAVLPDFRRKGYGVELVNIFINKCKEKAHTVFLEVRSRNTPARTLYKKCGFAEIAVRKNYYGDDDAVIYSFSFGKNV